MPNSTKQIIIDTAIQLFNERGYVNVRMRDIATKIGISPGNLTYHFKKKESIIEKIYEQIIESRNELLSNVQLIPTLVNIHEQLVPLMKLYKKYQFFYKDTLEIVRAHPKIAIMHQNHIEAQIQYIKSIIDYSVQKGTMKAEPFKGYYTKFAHTVWMVLSFWLSQQTIRNVNVKGDLYQDARQAMWNLVYPHFAEKGLKNFKKINQKKAVL